MSLIDPDYFLNLKDIGIILRNQSDERSFEGNFCSRIKFSCSAIRGEAKRICYGVDGSAQMRTAKILQCSQRQNFSADSLC